MHAFFTPFGIYPNNAIVGGSGSIAPGAALYKLVNKKDGIVVCNIGDGALGCGPVWEGMTRVGLHCAPRAHKTLGTFPQGTVRFSFGPENTAEEVELCLRAIRNILK